MEVSRMLNIANVDLEKAIEESIAETRNDLNNLTDERTCMIYTSYLYMKLLEKKVLAYTVDTYDDLKMDYRHQFVIVPKDGKKNYVVDLTYGQFGEDEEFSDIYDKGYQLLSKEEYDDYIKNIKKVGRGKK